jgi:DNA-binding GntR family transcriptional regulator
MAMQLAVLRLTDEEFDGLTALNEEMAAHAAGNKVEAFFEANLAFHARLLEASGNEKLQELYRQLLGQLGRYRLRSLTLRGNLQRSVSEHKTILRAARRGDAERAAQLMAEHIRVPQRRAMALEEVEPT